MVLEVGTLHHPHSDTRVALVSSDRSSSGIYSCGLILLVRAGKIWPGEDDGRLPVSSWLFDLKFIFTPVSFLWKMVWSFG